MEATTSIDAPGPVAGASPKASRLRASSDERLVKRIRSGSEEAFTALYERYHARLLSFCRHMLGSQAEAEDAVQQCFVNAYRDIVAGEKQLRVRPWLYRIARNQCLSALRSRRYDTELDSDQLALRGLTEEVLERADLRDLLRDLGRLPHDQREALVLSELNDNSHAEVAEILDCDREKVKSLVFQARSSLIKSREARALPCAEVQRQLSVLRGGSLRRAHLRRHLSECPACRAFHEEVKRQRAALALVLPVVPSASLKLGAPAVLAAAKAGTGAAAGGAASSGVAAGSTATLAAKLGVSGSAIKGAVAAVAVTAAVGGAAGVEVATHRATPPASRAPASSAAPRAQEEAAGKGAVRAVNPSVSRPRHAAARPSHGRKLHVRRGGNRRAHDPLREGRRAGGRRPKTAHRAERGSRAGGRPHVRSPGAKGRSVKARPERLRDPNRRRGFRPLRPKRGAPSATQPDAQDGGFAPAPK
jgi:RNA polymerase sigma factor (sigma-70 family)